MHVLLSTAPLPVSVPHKPNVKYALLKTGHGGPDIYIVPPRESEHRCCFQWKLLTAPYGLVKIKAK